MSGILKSGLLSSTKGDDGIQMFLSFASGAWALVGVSLTCGSEAIIVLLRPCFLTAQRAALSLPPSQAARAA